MTLCNELEELYPAYALDAIETPDRQRVESHISDCSNCAQIVAGYRAVADCLPYSVPQVEPPADLKYRVLAAALPKTKSPAMPAWRDNFARSLSNLLRSPAWSAAALVLAIALGIWNVSLQNQITQQAAINQQIQSDLTRNRALVSMMAYAQNEPKAVQATDAAPKAVGRLVAAPELNSLALIVYDMPALEDQRVYQVWLIDPAGGRTSGGIFTVDERGRAWVLIRAPQSLDHYQGIGVTIEPTGGSPKPTGTKMLGSSL